MLVNGAIPDELLNENAGTGNELAGALAVFIGKVRGDIINGKKVENIEFTAQESIAESISVIIIKESKNQFEILDAEVFHSIGTVNLGEACFLVKVWGRHRKESFAALQYIVDEVKNRCPIFGKEVFSGGYYKWKENKK